MSFLHCWVRGLPYRSGVWFVLWLGVLGWPSPAAAQPAIAYRVTITASGDAEAEIEMTIRNLANRDAFDVALPAWTPGSYEILNHAKNLFDLTAQTPDGKPLPVQRRDKQTWRVTCRNQPTVVLRYSVLCDRQSVDSNWLGDDYGQLVGAATFLYLPDSRRLPATLTLRLPPGWQAAVPLNQRPEGDYAAESYDALIDAPLLVGRLTRLDFTVRDKPISVVTARPPKDPAGLKAVVAKLVETYADLMGGLPFERYMFQYAPLEDEDEERLEGLEHANGTLINYAPETLLDNPRAKNFLAVTAHEFFHAWNVKRLKPCEFADYALDRELYTPQLWFAEGVTEYYAWRGLRRAGLITAADFDEAVQNALAYVINNPAAKAVSLADASLATWLTGTSNFEDIPLDYYRKGFLVGLLLDIELRVRTANARGLDDLMQRLLREFPANGPGYCAADIVRLAGELADGDLRPFFQRFVEGTDDLPMETALAQAGMTMLVEPLTELDFGFEWEATPAGLEIVEIEPDSPAGASELEEGDLLRTVAGKPVRSEDDFETVLATLRPNTPVKLTVLRDKRPVTVTLTPEVVTTLDVAVGPAPNPTPAQKAIRTALRGE
ncbi:MAG: PDZ domain-containing protein [Chloracidobacterium sp.]|nr:PDZ domain-containing protein [Chloracidobacterium sp.]MDW8218030.1 PDZ domain-containing protein [Acidobacteriota bacterium]